MFDLLTGNNMAPIVGEKIGHKKELPNLTMEFGQHLNRISHDLGMSASIDDRRSAKRHTVASSSKALQISPLVEPQYA